MEINIKKKGFWKRLFFETGTLLMIAILFIFNLVITLTVSNPDRNSFILINLLLFIGFSFPIIQSIIFCKFYIWKVMINETDISVFYDEYFTEKKINIKLDDIYLSFNEIKFVKGRMHRMKFYIKKNEKFECILRQVELGDWDFKLMQKLNIEVANKKYLDHE